MQAGLDAADAWLSQNEHFAGRAFSLADIHWMAYLEYLPPTGRGTRWRNGSTSTAGGRG